MAAEMSPCPWCSQPADYRDLTGRESVSLMTLTLFQGAALGVYHAYRRDLGYFRGLLTSGAERCCRACRRVVRVCPKCDAVSRWIDADVQHCSTCGTVFV
jgi:hypothetical protein